MSDEEAKHHYIALLSEMSGHYGEYLIALMDEYGARCLQDINGAQAEAFYKKITEGDEVKCEWQSKTETLSFSKLPATSISASKVGT